MPLLRGKEGAMSEKTAIEKMVKILEKKQSDGPISYTLDWVLREARRLASLEAKEKPTDTLLGCPVRYDDTLKPNEFRLEQRPTANADGNTSDGYHTFNELYDHRIALYLALANTYPDRFWKSKKHEDGSCFDGWFILGGNLGTGDISYHLPISKWDMANCQELPLGKKWDGHTAADVVDRLSRYRPVPVVKEQGEEGLREAVKDVYEDIMLNEDTEYDDAESVAVKLGEILVDTPAPGASGLLEEIKQWWRLRPLKDGNGHNAENAYHTIDEWYRHFYQIISRYSKEAK